MNRKQEEKKRKEGKDEENSKRPDIDKWRERKKRKT